MIRDPWFDKILLKNSRHLKKEFLDSCRLGLQDRVVYLLTSSPLKNHARLKKFINDGFCNAIEFGSLEIVKYLLSSKELSIHADIQVKDNFAFRTACHRGYTDIVKYLTSSNELKKHSNIHVHSDFGFCISKMYGHREILRHLIFDCNIEKSIYIVDALKHGTGNEIELWFKEREVRDMYIKIGASVPNELNDSICRRVKAKI